MTNKTRFYNSVPFCVFAICVILTLNVFLACTHNPPGCPLPEYSTGDYVLLDDVFIAKVLSVQVDGCGEIFYRLELNVTDEDGYPIIEPKIEEGRLSPYEPSVP